MLKNMEAQLQRSRPGLLTLPLEIRRMIYNFVQETRCIAPSPSAESRPTHYLAGTHLCRYRARKDFGVSRHLPYERLTLSALRATNKQLHYETLEYITYPRLSLQIVDTLEFKNWYSPEVQAIISDSFAFENIVTIYLHLALNGKYLYQNDPHPYQRQELQEVSPSYIPTRLSQLWTKVVAAPKNVVKLQRPFSLKPFVAFFDACPKLASITIINDYTFFYDLWKDPRGDLESFESLIMRGVKVELHQGRTRSGWQTSSFPSLMQSMSKDLQNGTQGKVFLSRLCGSDTVILKTLDQSAVKQDHTKGTVLRDHLKRRTADFQ